MATLMIRGLGPDTMRHVREYARDHGLQMPEAAAYFLRRGVADHQARRKGGITSRANMTAEERSAHAHRVGRLGGRPPSAASRLP